MNLKSMEMILFFFIYLYNFNLINHYGRVVKFKINKKIAIFLYSINIALISWSIIRKIIFLPTVYILILLLYIAVFKIIFDISLSCSYILSIWQIFQFITIKDITIGISAFICNMSMYRVVQNYNLNIFTTTVSYILVLIVMIIFSKDKYINKTRKLLLYRKKISLSILTITSLIIILLNSNYTYYYSGDIYTTTIIMVFNRLCIYICFKFAIGMAIKSIKWVEEEVFYKTSLLNIEYNEDMVKKIDEYSEILKIYTHDFKSILINIEDSINLGNNKKAKEIIHEFSNNINTLTKYNKKFSNNDLINALLNRINKECEDKNIHFESNCYIPNELSISELEMVTIFNNLSSNAFEACNKQNDDGDKFISFRSYVKEESLIIYQNNSFNGEIKFKKDKLITTKENPKKHGIGVESIKYIVNKVNGMAFIKVDKEKKEFEFLIKIPLSNFAH